MTTVTIDNRSYPCPSAWNEIGWEQFFTLAEYAGQTVGTSATESGAGTGAHLRSGSGNRSEDRRPAAKTVRRLPGRTFFRVSAAISGESGRKRQYGRFRLERNTDAVSRSGSRSRRQRRTASAYDGRRTVRSDRPVPVRQMAVRPARRRDTLPSRR